jgi:hypothetical protein
MRPSSRSATARPFWRGQLPSFLSNGSRKASLALARKRLCEPAPAPAPGHGEDADLKQPTFVCLHCGRAMVILQTFTRAQMTRAPPTP